MHYNITIRQKKDKYHIVWPKDNRSEARSSKAIFGKLVVKKKSAGLTSNE